MDSRICQTSTATPAEPGELPWKLDRVLVQFCYSNPAGSRGYAALAAVVDGSVGKLRNLRRGMRFLRLGLLAGPHRAESGT